MQSAFGELKTGPPFETSSTQEASAELLKRINPPNTSVRRRKVDRAIESLPRRCVGGIPPPLVAEKTSRIPANIKTAAEAQPFISKNAVLARGCSVSLKRFFTKQL